MLSDPCAFCFGALFGALGATLLTMRVLYLSSVAKHGEVVDVREALEDTQMFQRKPHPRAKYRS